MSPARKRAQRAAAAAPALLVVLALASLAGFAQLAATVLGYDAMRPRASGPLVGFSRSVLDALPLAPVALGLAIFTGATVRLGSLGALVAFAGYAIIGTVFAVMSPFADEPSVNLVCCDGVRSFMFIGAAGVGIGLLVFVTPIALLLRRLARRSGPAVA
jgi:hypothetical protein